MISLDNVTFGYDPFGEPQVRGVDLDIPEGQHVALLGRNGSGKSTLARLMNGLLVPQSGSVAVDGHSTADPAGARRARATVGLVFQNPENQQVGTTVYEDIAFGLAGHGVPTELMPERVRRALDLVGLDIELDRKITSLSGGQLQRQALASVLALEPRTIVLDEATSMLDPASREHLLGTLRRVKERVGLGIVQITHYLDEIEGADRALVVIDGRIARDTTPGELLSESELLERAGLEAPLTGIGLVELARAASASRSAAPANTAGPSTAAAAAAAAAAATIPVPEGARGDEPVLELRGASFSYERRARRRRVEAPVLALSATDLVLRSGELVAVAGPSGAGKTTLLNLIKGVARPTHGRIAISGQDPWERGRRGLFGGIGYVLQHPEHQLFATTVRGDIAFGLRGQGLDAERIETRVAEQVEAFGLPTDVLEASPFSLSGGQQRRVAMAGVFVNDPPVILLDEPTAGLDAPSRDLLFEMIHRERARGATVVWVSHRLEEIAGHATRLVVVDEGSIVADGDPERVFGDEDLAARVGWLEVAR